MRKLWKLLPLVLVLLLSGCALFSQHPVYANPNTANYVLSVKQDMFGYCMTFTSLNIQRNNPGPADDVYALEIQQFFNCGTNTFEILGINSNGEPVEVDGMQMTNFYLMGFILYNQYATYQILRNGVVIAVINKQ